MKGLTDYNNFHQKYFSDILTAFFLTWLLTGVLDALAGIYLLGDGNAGATFAYIASGAYGPEALHGGTRMVAMGVVFHFVIAGCFAGFYFVVYPYVSFFRNHFILGVVLYAVFVWAVMRLVVLPLSLLHLGMHINIITALKNIAILTVTIAIPNALIRGAVKQKNSTT